MLSLPTAALISLWVTIFLTTPYKPTTPFFNRGYRRILFKRIDGSSGIARSNFINIDKLSLVRFDWLAGTIGTQRSETNGIKRTILNKSIEFRESLQRFWESNDPEAFAISEQKKAEVVGLIAQLSSLNRETAPYHNWLDTSVNGRRKLGKGETCPIDGTWDVVFSTSADTNIKPSPPLGAVAIQQRVSSSSGEFLNELDYPQSKGLLAKCSILIDGEVADDEPIRMLLSFNRVTFSFRSSILPTFTLPLPRLRFLKPSFTTLYADANMRAQVTNTGEYYVFTRL